MRQLVRILAGLALVAAVIAVIRRLVTGGADTPPAPVPWKPLESDDVVQPAPTTAVADEPVVDTDTGAAAGSVVPITPVDDGPSDNGASSSAPKTESTDGDADWVEANADGSCPNPFPVKAKLSSKIFHVPGGMSYERTNADRCYLNEAAAENDGLRQAKR